MGWDYNGFEFQETERYLGLFHEVAPADEALTCASCHSGGTRLNFANLGYTPRESHNNKPLCTSCHSDESDEWNASEYFEKVHQKHVDSEGYDCIECHSFSAMK